MEIIQIITTVDSEEGANKIANELVSRRLVACCWVSGPIRSTYWWQGKMEQAQEWVCSAKTRRDLYEAVETAIKATHPYDVPDIVATPILAGSKSYLDWIVEETKTTH